MDINLPDVLAEVTAGLRALRRGPGHATTWRCSTNCSGTARTPCATAPPKTSTATTRSGPFAPARPAQGLAAHPAQDRHHHLRQRHGHRQRRVPARRQRHAPAGRARPGCARPRAGAWWPPTSACWLSPACWLRAYPVSVHFPISTRPQGVATMSPRPSTAAIPSSPWPRSARPARWARSALAPWRRSRSPSASSTSARATTTATTRRRPQAAAELKKMPGIKVVEEENVPETAAVQKTMTRHDRAGRRHAAVPHLVRLLRPAHAGGGAPSTPTCASRTAAACGPRASTRRTPAATSATSTSASTSTA